MSISREELLNLGESYSEVIGQTLSDPCFTRILIAGRVDRENGEAAIMAHESAKRAVLQNNTNAHITGIYIYMALNSIFFILSYYDEPFCGRWFGIAFLIICLFS